MIRLLSAFKSIKTYRKVSALLAVLLLGMMWFFSGQNGEDSGRLSGRVLDLLLRLWGREVTYSTREYLAFFVRKAAHFSLFLCLGFLSALAIGSVERPILALIALPACALCAFVDEAHQYFVAQRAAQLKDCMIDISGALCGVLIAFGALMLVARRRAKRASPSRAES